MRINQKRRNLIPFFSHIQLNSYTFCSLPTYYQKYISILCIYMVDNMPVFYHIKHEILHTHNTSENILLRYPEPQIPLSLIHALNPSHSLRDIYIFPARPSLPTFDITHSSVCVMLLWKGNLTITFYTMYSLCIYGKI